MTPLKDVSTKEQQTIKYHKYFEYLFPHSTNLNKDVPQLEYEGFFCTRDSSGVSISIQNAGYLIFVEFTNWLTINRAQIISIQFQRLKYKKEVFETLIKFLNIQKQTLKSVAFFNSLVKYHTDNGESLEKIYGLESFNNINSIKVYNEFENLIDFFQAVISRDTASGIPQ